MARSLRHATANDGSVAGVPDYPRFFAEALDGLRAAGNYRVFADLERRVDDFPRAVHHGGGVSEVTVRSEEHTSELQSLMRISYAVFCLKKTKKNTQHTS